ncbi:MAG TPA: hypothetical protein VFB93_24320, partial [Burkholderiales bacterium]|nr:hypothetical protein [Burkholderiales bacterium]
LIGIAFYPPQAKKKALAVETSPAEGKFRLETKATDMPRIVWSYARRSNYGKRAAGSQWLNNTNAGSTRG